MNLGFTRLKALGFWGCTYQIWFHFLLPWFLLHVLLDSLLVSAHFLLDSPGYLLDSPRSPSCLTGSMPMAMQHAMLPLLNQIHLSECMIRVFLILLIPLFPLLQHQH